jgi:thioredoxin-like negative regulator of GroEL
MPFLRRHMLRLTDQLTETQWDVARALALVVAAGTVALAGYFLGLPAWRHWQNRKALAQARVFAEKRDYRDLMLALRRATELAPGDLATWRAAAQILAEIGSPDTLVAREELTQIAPRDMALRLALAEDALRFGRFDTAESALDGLDAAARQDVAFHRLAAALAMAMGRNTDLERELKEMITVAPGDADAQLNYAAFRLWRTDGAESAAGEAELERLTAVPQVRVRAAIELLSSFSRVGDPGKVSQILTILLSRFAPQAAPDFSAPAIPAWGALIEGLKAAAAPSPGDAALMARWLATLGHWTEALSWVESLPPATRNSHLVADIAAEICAEHDDIGHLSQLLRDGAWGSWPSGAQALALAARIQVLHFRKDIAAETWSNAISVAGDSPVGLRALARLASEWHYPTGEESVLRRILANDPKAFWAYAALRGVLLQREDLKGLAVLYASWSRQLPDDPSVTAASIMLDSILNRGGADAVERAAALHARFPDSLPAQVSHAAALWRGGRAAEAWGILAALPPAARQRPDVAFWVALIQADLGHRAETAAALALAVPGATTAEERELLRAASAKAGLSP